MLFKGVLKYAMMSNVDVIDVIVAQYPVVIRCEEGYLSDESGLVEI